MTGYLDEFDVYFMKLHSLQSSKKSILGTRRTPLLSKSNNLYKFVIQVNLLNSWNWRTGTLTGNFKCVQLRLQGRRPEVLHILHIKQYFRECILYGKLKFPSVSKHKVSPCSSSFPRCDRCWQHPWVYPDLFCAFPNTGVPSSACTPET